MPTLPYVRASIGGRFSVPKPVATRVTTQVTAASMTRQVQHLMAAAGVTGPGADGRFSPAQVEQMLAGKNISQRIEAKSLLISAGLYPGRT
jgi:hypothetical protein